MNWRIADRAGAWRSKPSTRSVGSKCSTRGGRAGGPSPDRLKSRAGLPWRYSPRRTRMTSHDPRPEPTEPYDVALVSPGKPPPAGSGSLRSARLRAKRDQPSVGGGTDATIADGSAFHDVVDLIRAFPCLRV